LVLPVKNTLPESAEAQENQRVALIQILIKKFARNLM